jgi:hypothetical protein
MHFNNDPAIWLKDLFINAGLGAMAAVLNKFEIKVFRQLTGDDMKTISGTN